MDIVSVLIEQLIVQYSMEKLTDNVYVSEQHKLVLTTDNTPLTHGLFLQYLK